MQRGKGEGSIYQRDDGRWVGVVELEPGPNGARRRRTLYGRTRREVLSKVDQAREALRQGATLPTAVDQRITVGALVEEWLAGLSEGDSGVRELTRAQYRVEARTRVLPTLGRLPIVKLDDEALLAWQRALAKRYAPRSILKARTVIAGVIMLARRKKILHANPLELVAPPATRKPKKRAISGAEAGRFLRQIRGHPWETLMLADLLTGMRRGELLGWAWEDLDLDAGTIHIRQQVQRLRRKGLVILEPKTEAGDRIMPLPSLLVDRLRVLTGDQRGLIFTDKGEPIDPRRFNRQFKALVEAAGIAPLTPHELRHSMSTVLQHLGVPAVVVSQLLGHADASVTLRWYTHAVPEAQREAMARMDDYVRRVQDEHGANGYTNGYIDDWKAPKVSSKLARDAPNAELSQS